MAAIEVDATTTIDAQPDVVWRFASDPSRYPEWSVVTERMTAVEDDQVNEGSVYREIGGPGPVSAESEWVVREYEPIRRQVHEGDDGTIRTVMTLEFEPVDDGERTRLHQRIELHFPPGFKLIARFVGWLFLRRVVASIVEETVGNAKRIVESERSAIA